MDIGTISSRYANALFSLAKEEKQDSLVYNDMKILQQNFLSEPTLKNVLNNPRLTGIHNTIGKVIETDPKYVVALDVALASSSNFIITSDEASAKKAITYL